VSQALTNKRNFFFRLFNFYLFALSVFLLLWMTFHSWITRPICEAKLFKKFLPNCSNPTIFEIRDRGTLAIFLISIFMFYLLQKNFSQHKILKRQKLTRFFNIGALICVLATIYSRDYYPSTNDRSVLEFSGFGPKILITIIVLVSISFYFLRSTNREHCANLNFVKSKLIRFVEVVFFLTIYLPALLQPSNGLSSPENSLFAFNELLGPISGSFPFSDLIPQYSSVLGLPLLLLQQDVNRQLIFWALPLYISALNIILIVLVSLLFHKILSKKCFPQSLIIVSGLLLARSSDSPGAYTIASFPSWVGRLFLPVCVALALIFAIDQQNQSHKKFLFATLGIISIFSAINNLEFGLSSFISLNIVFIIFFMAKKNIPKLSFFYIGVLIGILFHFCIYQQFDKSFRVDYYFLISREFGKNGFMNWPMPIFGSFILFLAVIGSSLVYLLDAILDKSKDHISNLNLGIIAVGIYGGTWSIQTYLYYAARSVDGNLRVLLIPALICFIPAFKLAVGKLSFFQSFISDPLLVLPIFCTILLPFAMIIDAPNPTENWRRVFDAEVEWSYDSILNLSISRALLEMPEIEKESTGFMANNGNAISLVTGAKNLLATNSLADLQISAKVRLEVCERLDRLKVKTILIENTNTVSQKPPCPRMVKIYSPNNSQFTIFKLE